MLVQLLTEHLPEFLSLKGGCRDWSESTHVKMPHCWKSHANAHIVCLHCLYQLTSNFNQRKHLLNNFNKLLTVGIVLVYLSCETHFLTSIQQIKCVSKVVMH